MEAVAKHDFKTSADDELSFDKGDTIKVLSATKYDGWCKGELDGREGFIPANYINIKLMPHAAKLGRAEAEAFLLQTRGSNRVQPNGAFVIRLSESAPGDFQLSVKHDDQVQHFKVLRDGGGKYFLWFVKFASINELTRYHRTTSVSRSQTIYLKDLVSPIPKGLGIFDTEPIPEGIDLSFPPLPEPNVTVLAKYDFKPEEVNELELRKGDIIKVIEKHDQNWWTGEIMRNNKLCRGMFPVPYVVLIE